MCGEPLPLGILKVGEDPRPDEAQGRVGRSRGGLRAPGTGLKRQERAAWQSPSWETVGTLKADALLWAQALLRGNLSLLLDAGISKGTKIPG